MIINKENINNLPEIIITAPRINILEAYDANPELIEDPNVGIVYYPLPITLEPILKEIVKDEMGILPHRIYIKSKYDQNNRYYEFSIYPKDEFILKSQVLKQIFGYLGAKKIKISFTKMIIDEKNLEEKIKKTSSSNVEGKVKFNNISLEEKSDFDYKEEMSNINNTYKKIKQAINEELECEFKIDFLKAKELAIKTGIWYDSCIGLDIQNIAEGIAKYPSFKKEVDFYFEIKGKIEKVYELFLSSTVSGGIGIGTESIKLLLGGRYKTYERTCEEFHSIKEIKICLEVQF